MLKKLHYVSSKLKSVKTALFAEDPNWGREVSALGNPITSYI